MYDVQGADRRIVAPDQADQLVDAGGPAGAGQEQREKVGLLSWAGVQFDTVAPDPQWSEDLEV